MHGAQSGANRGVSGKPLFAALVTSVSSRTVVCMNYRKTCRSCRRLRTAVCQENRLRSPRNLGQLQDRGV
ncbi:Uncharacterised protein [Paucimonas lemoignei]|nr:Uncharacterised protein [Paucimonas lemoignei]